MYVDFQPALVGGVSGSHEQVREESVHGTCFCPLLRLTAPRQREPRGDLGSR